MNVVHRLGLVLCVVTALGWIVHEVAVRRRERALLRRLNALLETVAEKPAGRGVDVRGAVGRWGPPMGAVCAGYVLVGGAAGLGLGLVAAFGVWRWRRRARAAADVASSSEAAHAQARRQLPLAADLLAACIAMRRRSREGGEGCGGVAGRAGRGGAGAGRGPGAARR